jgi:L-ascorbate metabolism protein UlaG (beta-lactamase superfamily)
MHISWLGGTTIKLQTKYLDSDATVLIDPYKPAEGSFPRSLTADVALLTRGESEMITLSGTPFTLSTPGEIDSKGVLVTGIAGHAEDSVLFRIDIEGVSIAHLGLISAQLTSAQLEILSGVDIVFIPVGNKRAFDTELALKTINSLEPRVIIPIAFKSDNDPDAASPDSFIRGLGAQVPSEEKKVIIKKKDLPEEETKVILLGKE